MYDRKLIDYLPEFEQNIKEFDAILTKAEDPEMILGWGAVENAFNDQFILDATENGVARMEKIMSIVPKATDDLEARKFTLLTRTSEQPPFTINRLKEQMDALCGAGNYEIKRDIANKTLSVTIALVAKSNCDDVKALLERIVPANMVINLSLKYRRHEQLKTYTHEELSKFTHYELRNEVE